MKEYLVKLTACQRSFTLTGCCCVMAKILRKNDGMVDIMVKEEDAHRINWIVKCFWFVSVTGSAQIKTEIQRSKKEK